jgi:hypothetical protein
MKVFLENNTEKTELPTSGTENYRMTNMAPKEGTPQLVHYHGM